MFTLFESGYIVTAIYLMYEGSIYFPVGSEVPRDPEAPGIVSTDRNKLKTRHPELVRSYIQLFSPAQTPKPLEASGQDGLGRPLPGFG